MREGESATADAPAPGRAFWVTAPGRGEIRETPPLQPPGPGELRVRTLFSGVSRGTELLVFRGEVPASERERMRAPHQEGDFPAPVKYGYSSVGEVEAGDPDWVGQRVFCLYPHQTRYQVPTSAVHRLPEDLPSRRAILAANMETAVNALWDGAPRVGDRIVVVGGGTVGALVAWLAGRIPGTRVQLVDLQAGRREVAHALGVEFALPGDNAVDADLVYHASGSEAGLATALGAAGFEARVVELSWYGSRGVRVPLGEAFHSARLSLLSSQVGHVAASRRARHDRPARMQLALRLLCDAALDSAVGEDSAFAELPALMTRLAAGDTTSLCHCIRYE